ncbi:P-loop containing nucleoside triphosphate hydrolase protein [Syncephalis fuscata]|nr:P-loop containing nucleoside triphosphate hydrolase protein [Syncephalis fuscata]
MHPEALAKQPTTDSTQSVPPTSSVKIEELLNKLLSSPYYEGQVAPEGRRTFPARKEQFKKPNEPLSDGIRQALYKARGIKQFYTHQAKALDYLAMENIGKSVIYQVPTLKLLEQASTTANHAVRILWMFPTKALSRDQLESMKQLVGAHPQLDDWAHILAHDGDTANDREMRKQARDEAHVILTNPDTLHMSILPYADRWRNFFTNLRLVVLDELHVCAGGFGAHVAVIIRRLRRMCAAYGNKAVQFISCSATIANPVEHMSNLFGLETESIALVETDGAPQGRKEFMVWNPPLHNPDMPELGRRRSILESARIMAFLVQHHVRSILFCRTRKVCELVLQHLHDLLNESGLNHLIPYVTSYRSGYDPKDRRRIEKSMFSGQLLAVIATSALELGVDIGALDAVVLLGVPWNKAALWQQMGRAGRRRQTSMAILVAEEQPLDQYYARRLDQLFEVTPEIAADWSHSPVLGAQLQCAAYERVIDIEEDQVWFGAKLKELCQAHLIRINSRYYRSHPDMSDFPPSQVAIRGRLEKITGRQAVIEEMEAVRALFTIYEGAIYLHQGKRYLVDKVNVEDCYIIVRQVNVTWLTQQRDFTDLDPLETLSTCSIGSTQQRSNTVVVYYGIVQMKATVFGYYKLDGKTGQILDSVDIDMPPVIRTRPGICHALAHVCLSVIPSFVLCNAEDMRAECKNPHATRYRPPRLVLQDNTSGVGVAIKVYNRIYNILQEAYQLVSTCSCKEGCPHCVNSALCTEYNQVLSKKGACILLDHIIDLPSVDF